MIDTGLARRGLILPEPSLGSAIQVRFARAAERVGGRWPRIRRRPFGDARICARKTAIEGDQWSPK
jgi:hypothetical protein